MAFIELPSVNGRLTMIELGEVQQIRPFGEESTNVLMAGRCITVLLPYERVKEILRRDFYIREWSAGADTTEEPEVSAVESDGETDNADDAGGSLGGLPEAEAEAGHRDAGTVRGQLAEDEAERTSTEGFDELFRSPGFQALVFINRVNQHDPYGWTQRCRHQAGLPQRRAVYVGFNERVV